MQNSYTELVLLAEELRNKQQPVLSVVVPVFNQELVIRQVLDSIEKCVDLPFELILIDDASEDDSRAEILNWMDTCLSSARSELTRVRFLISESQVFETACDSQAFELAVAPYILEVQADMVLTETGFVRRFVKAFDAFPNLLALSGRGVQSFESAFELFLEKGGTTVSRSRSPFIHAAKSLFAIAFNLLGLRLLMKTPAAHVSLAGQNIPLQNVCPSDAEFKHLRSAGRLGSLVNFNPSLQEFSNQIWFGETIMRGPIMFSKSLYTALGGFDCDSFFLGYDDHDLCLRAAFSGMIVGYMPIEFESPETWGSSRKARTLTSEHAIMRKRFQVQKHLKESRSYRTCVSGSYPAVISERRTVE